MFIGAFVVHVAIRLPRMASSLRERSFTLELRTDTAHTRPEAKDEYGWSPTTRTDDDLAARRARPGRRQLAGAAGVAAARVAAADRLCGGLVDGQPALARGAPGRPRGAGAASLRGNQIADPLHLLELAGCFALAAYAGLRLWADRPIDVTIWLFVPVVAHDLALVPLYALADRSVRRVLQHRRPTGPSAPWINYVRVPVVISAVLLMVYFPVILRRPEGFFENVTTFTMQIYLARYLGIVGGLFLASAVLYALRLRRTSRAAG